MDTNTNNGKETRKVVKKSIRMDFYEQPTPKTVKQDEEFDLEGYENIVDFILQKRYGGKLTNFAQELSNETGFYVTRQKIDGWKVRGQFPIDWIETIHKVTKVPIRALMQRKMPLPR